jgi:uncharacterized protein (TIRG00374 family)
MTLRENLWQFVVLGMVVTLILSIYADLDALTQAFQRFEWILIPVVLGLTLANQFLRFLKWEYLLGEVDVNLPLSTSFYIFGSGLIMIMTPGKLGEVWKSWLVRDEQGTTISTTMPVVATERITDLLGVVSISLLGVIAFDRSPLVLVILSLPIIGGILILQYERVCYWILDRIEQVPVMGGKADSLRDLYDNSRALLRPRPLGVTTGLSICSWGLECVGMWVVLQGFDAEVSLIAAAFVFAVASILGAVSLLPGGLGVTEGSITGLLLMFGVEKVQAASTTLVIRAATLWFVAGLALAIYMYYQRQQSVTIQESLENMES